VAAVIAAAEERPLLLVVDDAQWLDAASLASLPALARDCAPHCVLLLLGVALGVPDAQRFDELQARLGRDLEGAVIRRGGLGAAAALGGRGDVERLARATALERGAVAQALDLLEWDRWLAADAHGYVFTAPIERDIVLQEMLTPGQARRYRDLVASLPHS